MADVDQFRNCEDERLLMVRTQLVGRGMNDQRVLDAMSRVPREEFVAPELQYLAYGDHPVPIEGGQTVSQPYTVAFMIEAAQIAATDKVLEIGTGSGYGAAVLSLLADEVHTIERISLLAERSRERLQRLGYANVHVHEADGTLGLAQQAPFDAIIVTAGARKLPNPFKAQLRDGGRIVIPIGETRNGQSMYRFTKQNNELRSENLGGFAFVPLVGKHGWRR